MLPVRNTQVPAGKRSCLHIESGRRSVIPLRRGAGELVTAFGGDAASFVEQLASILRGATISIDLRFESGSQSAPPNAVLCIGAESEFVPSGSVTSGN